MSDERGNALFLILLGVVLFAALTAAVSNGFRGSNSALSGSRTDALANDIILNGVTIERAVEKLTAKSVSESRMSFTRKSGDGYELTPAESASEKVFNIAGGGAQYLDPPKDALDKNMSAQTGYGSWIYTGSNVATGNGLDTEGDLIAILPYVRKDLCLLINTKAGVTNPAADTTPQSNGPTYVGTKFTGTFSNAGRIKANPYLNGKKMGCFQGTADESSNSIVGRYYFYYVVLSR